MKSNLCEIVRDLLPLYVDQVCSEPSSELVREHLSVCADCRELEQNIRNTNIDSIVEKETESVIGRYVKKERSKTWGAGAVIAVILSVPVLLVAVIMAASNASMNFLVLPIVISSMLLAASLTVVPLMSRKERFARLLLASAASIIMIEFFASLYSGFSFASAAVPTVFGLSVPFMPFVLKADGMPKIFSEKKALSVLTWDIVWLFLTITVCTLPQRENSGLSEGTLFLFVILIFAVIIFAVPIVIKSKMNKLTKGAILLLTAGLLSAFIREAAKMYIDGISKAFIGVFDLSNLSPAAIISQLVLTVLGATIFIISIYIIVNIINKIISEE